MESLVRDHIMEFFFQNNYFSKNQFGCIKGRSTALQLLRVRFAGGVQPSQWFFYPPSPRRFELQFNFCYRLSLPWTYGKGFYDHGIHGCKMSEGVFHRTSDFSCMKIENRMHCSSYDQWSNDPWSAGEGDRPPTHTPDERHMLISHFTCTFPVWQQRSTVHVAHHNLPKHAIL